MRGATPDWLVITSPYFRCKQIRDADYDRNLPDLDEDELEMIYMYKRKLSETKIGNIFDRSRSSVRSVIHKAKRRNLL